MSAQPEENKTNHYSWLERSSSRKKRVDVNDLVSKMNDDKKKDKKMCVAFRVSSH